MMSHGLMQVLLLDEITVDLDVLGRADLLRFLRQETQDRNATIIYVSLLSMDWRRLRWLQYWKAPHASFLQA